MTTDRRRLLVLNFFPAFSPPKSGGELRVLHLYRELAQDFDVDLVSWTDFNVREELIRHADGFNEYRIPKGNEFYDAYSALGNLGVTGELSGVACAMVGRGQTRFHEVVEELIGDASAVVHEFPYTAYYDRGLGLDPKPRIYNSHNYESAMVRAVVQGDYAPEVYELVEACETTLLNNSSLVFATSEQDLLSFHLLEGVPKTRLHLAPNGFSPDTIAADLGGLATSREKEELQFLFLGSQHGPNVEAANFIVHRLAPQFSTHRFVIAGNCLDRDYPHGANVDVLGSVSDDERKHLFGSSDVFLNPISTGSGTSLKLIEALASGLPVITTGIGARGIEIVDGQHAVVSSLDDFDKAVSRLVSDPSIRAQIAAEGRRKAWMAFTWKGIASSVGPVVNQLLDDGPLDSDIDSVRQLMVINDYPVEDPVAGGSRRMFSLLSRVAKDFRVVLLCLGNGTSLTVKELAPQFFQVCVPKTPEHIHFESTQRNLHWVSVDDIASGLFVLENRDFLSAAQTLADRSVALVMEHPYLTPVLQFLQDVPPVIYEAQNVEGHLKGQLLETHPNADRLVPFVETAERHLLREAAHVICVSEEDQQRFLGVVPDLQCTVLRNGTDLLDPGLFKADRNARHSRSEDGKIRAIFVGSGHPPNVEGAAYLCSTLTRQVPKLHVTIVGSVCDALTAFQDLDSVDLVGEVSDEELTKLLRESDLGINPTTSGGGSNLKLGLYLGHGLPTITTHEGARGYELEAHEAAVSCQLDMMGAAITDVAQDAERRAQLAKRGYRYASSTLSWDMLARAYTQLINDVALPSREANVPMRVLAVTYRYTEPTRGGAEEFLLQVLRQLRSRAPITIDLFALGVDEIWNRGQFMTGFEQTHREPQQFVAPFARAIRHFATDTVDRTGEQWLDALLSDWRQQESISLGRHAFDRIDGSFLLGGWHSAETHGSRSVRWSSPKAEIALEKGISGLTLTGWAPSAIPLTTRINDGASVERTVSGEFEIKLKVNSRRRNLVALETTRHSSDGDSRALGFILTSWALENSEQGDLSSQPIEANFEEAWRRADPEGWIDALRATAESRPEEVNLAFRGLRGPTSRDAVDHIRQKAHEYDVVLVQGMPFTFAVDVVNSTAKSGAKTIMLPHIHVDDPFYHWRHFYEAFQSADRVIVPSQVVRSALTSPIGATGVVLPGGGVNPFEYSELAPDIQAFREVHGRPLPYFLVLGRKSGAKRYAEVIRARDLLASQGMEVDVVLIGPDEDGMTLDSDGIFYYGRQPREVVRGALASAAGVVSMSESESFGLTLVEAWMCGRPVIASARCLSFREMVTDGLDGFLVDSVEDLAVAMSRLVDDSDFARVMGSRGRRKALTTYTWASLARSLEERLREVANAKG